MITNQGTLPVGIEVDGVVHSEFELRPQLVRDSIEALKDERAVGNDSLFGLALLAQQLMKLGSLQKEQITLDLLLDAYDVDMSVLMEAAASLRERLKTFRGEASQSAQAAATTA
jgi:hypothetical protein